MTISRWRAYAQAIIAEIEPQYRNQSYGAYKRALHDAYPFGQRKYTPYKIWCDEQRNALARHPESPDYRPPVVIDQGDLFCSQTTPADAGKEMEK